MQVTIEDVQAQRGSTAQFQAVIEGNPQPTVTWYRVGTGTGLGAGTGECVAFPPASKALAVGRGRDRVHPQVGLTAAPPTCAPRMMPRWWTASGSASSGKGLPTPWC